MINGLVRHRDFGRCVQFLILMIFLQCGLFEWPFWRCWYCTHKTLKEGGPFFASWERNLGRFWIQTFNDLMADTLFKSFNILCVIYPHHPLAWSICWWGWSDNQMKDLRSETRKRPSSPGRLQRQLERKKSISEWKLCHGWYHGINHPNFWNWLLWIILNLSEFGREQ